MIEKDITIITTLYKTPKKQLKNLKQYKQFKLEIFDQEGDGNTYENIKEILPTNIFKYYNSKKNIGLSKSSNFLFSKVKTKFCLFTQADVKIGYNSIKKLYNVINKNRSIILVSPNHSLIKKNKKIEITKDIDFSCLLIDVKKMKKIGFFDKDFFLYWEDIFLKRKINNSIYKMAIVNNAFAIHNSSQSSINNLSTLFIREKNFLYGELLYDLKTKKLRNVKILRKLVQNIILFFFNIFTFQLQVVVKNFARIVGVLKFLVFITKH